MRPLGPVPFLAAMLASSVALSAPAPAPRPPLLNATEVQPFLAPGQRIPVEGGRRINLVCRGGGAPTVVLDAGAANYSLSWAKVFGPVSVFTRVCAYDRAGYWFSDPNDRPSTAANVVDDLHRALAGGGIRPPYVLVGHSAGGLYATLYADLHLEEVAGMVLVDPGFAGAHLVDQLFLAGDDLATMTKQNTDFRALLVDCAGLARAHDSAAIAAKACPCGLPPDAVPPELSARFAAYCATPEQYEGVLAEDSAYNVRQGTSPSDRDETAAAKPFGSIPLIVLTSAADYRQVVTPETTLKQTMGWRAGHVVLSSRSSQGRVQMVQGSNHSIQLSRPDAVVAAVREVVEAARTAPRAERP